MKYKVQFILDSNISTERNRDIKLSLLQDSVDMSIESDYPIYIPNDYIYLSDIKFKILLKEVRIKSYHITEITIIDFETYYEIKRNSERISDFYWE
jgi:hypothetical protein